MSYKCMIVDDEELARGLIASYLKHLDDFEIVASCTHALEARKVLQDHHIDLLFLDIELPLLKGTDFFKSLTTKPKVIFTTAFRNYAVEGFELNAIDYLVKPIEFDRFMKATEKFIDSNHSKPEKLNDFFYIQSNKKNIKVVLNDIQYIESLKDYIQIHFSENKLMFKAGISAFEKKLDERFLRVHRSFIVNIDKVTAFTKHDIEIGKIAIPIGESYKSEVLKRL